MGSSEWGKPPNALRAKGVEKKKEKKKEVKLGIRTKGLVIFRQQKLNFKECQGMRRI
jgi:hypothetical protein